MDFLGLEYKLSVFVRTCIPSLRHLRVVPDQMDVARGKGMAVDQAGFYLLSARLAASGAWDGWRREAKLQGE